MPEFVIVLVEPLIPGNIGSVARSMSNFGLSELRLYNPCYLGDDAYRFAKHGRFIIENAKIVDSLDEAYEGLDLLVGTSGAKTDSQKKFLRQPVTPKEFTEHVKDMEGKIGLIFGREDQGLSNDELARCDMLVNIPTHEINPIMNLSQAATVMFYELFSADKSSMTKLLASEFEKETLNDIFAELLEEINYSAHKKAKTKIMFRKIIARADLSEWEFHTMAGVYSRAIKSVRWEREGKEIEKEKGD